MVVSIRVVFFCLVLLTLTVTGCFLNSCPYRRYGRNVRCAHCGPKNEGVCAADGLCCTSKACMTNELCLGAPTCSPRSCNIQNVYGFCVSSSMCCTQDFCQQSLICMLSPVHPTYA